MPEKNLKPVFKSSGSQEKRNSRSVKKSGRRNSSMRKSDAANTDEELETD